MSLDKELGEVLAYVVGTGQTDPDMLGRLALEQLNQRGYRVLPIAAPVVDDVAPDTLKRVRRALGLTPHKVAREAGLQVASVNRAEIGGATGRDVPDKIARALIRLGAKAAT